MAKAAKHRPEGFLQASRSAVIVDEEAGVLACQDEPEGIET
jgi:hypothetical protein